MATKRKRRSRKKRKNPSKKRSHRRHATHHAAAPRRRRRRTNPKRRHHKRRTHRRRRNPASSGGKKTSVMSLVLGAALGLGSAVVVRAVSSKIAPGSAMAQKGLAAVVGTGSVLLLRKKHPVAAASIGTAMVGVAFMNELALHTELALAGGSPDERARVAGQHLGALGSDRGYIDLNGLERTSGDIAALLTAGGDIQGVHADMGGVAADMGDLGDAIDRVVEDMGDPFFGGDSVTG